MSFGHGSVDCTTSRRSILDKVRFLLTADNLFNLLYGSDWEMLGIEAHSDQYFERFAKLLANPKLFEPDIPPHVLSANAEDFLGLHSGQNTRSRLEDFYKRRGVTAEWPTHIA